MTDTTIILIKPAGREQDEYGVWRTTAPRRREVYAQVSRATRAEFASAGQAGHRPDYQFTIFRGEYEGETVCEYNSIKYAIYRPYEVPGTDYMELYVQREVGVS